MNRFWWASALVAAVMAGLGLCFGALWAVLTPGVHGIVIRSNAGPESENPGIFISLTGESTHFFDSLAIFLGFSVCVGFFSALVVWSWKSYRGIEVFCGLLVGSTLSAYLAIVLGNALVKYRFGSPDLSQIGQYYTAAPSLVIDKAQWNFQLGPFFGPQAGWDGASWLAILPLPLVVSVVYLVAAALNLRDDLGAHVEPRVSKNNGEIALSD